MYDPDRRRRWTGVTPGYVPSMTSTKDVTATEESRRRWPAQRQPREHKCVQRPMQKMGLRALIRSKKRPRAVASVSDAHVANVLQRNFFAAAPNQKWATDITEFNVNGQKLYLSAYMDLYNREIIAHCIALRPVFKLVSETLSSALEQATGSDGLMVHSDLGWHFRMQPYRSLLREHGAVQSMSRKANCFGQCCD